MERHIRIIAILYIVVGALGLVPALIVFVSLTGAGLISGDTEAMAITAGIGTALGIYTIWALLKDEARDLFTGPARAGG